MAKRLEELYDVSELSKNDIYWLERVLDDEQRMQKLADGYSERIQTMYRSQYLKVAKKLERLMEEVEKGKSLSRTKLWNYSRWREIERSLSSFVTGGSVIEREAIHKCLDKVFEEAIGVPVESLNTAMFTVKPDPRTVIDTAWSGERFSSRVWNNRAALAQRIKIDMEDMIVQGRGLSEMKRELMDEFGVGYRKADTLLRTEANYVMNRAHMQRYESMGLKKVRWNAKNLEAKRCEICGGRNGKVFWIESAPIAPAHPHCGCRYTGVVEFPGEEVPVDGEGLPMKGAGNAQQLLNVRVESGIMKVDAEAIVAAAKMPGGRHNGKYIDAQGWKDSSIRKAVSSCETTVMEHIRKINSPQKYDAGWANKTEVQKQGLLNKWEKDIRKNMELLAVFRAILEERGIGL